MNHQKKVDHGETSETRRRQMNGPAAQRRKGTLGTAALLFRPRTLGRLQTRRVLRRNQTARLHALTPPKTRQPRCHRAKPPLCSSAGCGTSGLVPNRWLALKPEGTFTPLDEPDRLAPVSGESPIPPPYPIHRKTVPPVLT